MLSAPMMMPWPRLAGHGPTSFSRTVFWVMVWPQARTAAPALLTGPTPHPSARTVITAMPDLLPAPPDRNDGQFLEPWLVVG